MDPIRVFVGTDRSQFLAVKVLEYSIKRHTSHPVEVIPMINLDVPIPKDIENQARTGFSFYRFCIPALCGYKGRAIYMDADMQVFKDISELWNWPMGNAKVLVQEDLSESQKSNTKLGSPVRRWKQCSVMLLDCERLDWDIKKIVQDLDEKKYSYDQLMKELCILPEDEVGYTIPFRWNSLEHFDSSTCNIHYTDMATQPWVSSLNKNGYVWFQEVARMVKDGVLSLAEIDKEIAEGYFRPSLRRDIIDPKPRKGLEFWMNGLRTALQDKIKGYQAHKKVMQHRAELLKTLPKA